MKHLNKILVFIFLATVCSCASQDDFNKVQQENIQLKEELEEMKFGPERLLKQATNFYNNSQFDSAEAKLNLLISKHNESNEAQEGRKLLAKLSDGKSQLEDLNAWKAVESSNVLSSIEGYIQNHSNGKYLTLARQKIASLKVENEKSAYEYAESQNSSYTWSKFIADYPGRSDIEEIKRKIIKAEIAEIRGSSNVSSLPSSNQMDDGYSANSNVSITNNTGYELTVRYSGPDITSISIPAGSTRTVYLKSGSYQVGATAGSVSCAGNEDLHGTYSSSYTIRTTTGY